MYILHLYHPSGPCRRYVFHSRVKACKLAKSWLEEHFADRVQQCLTDIMAETDYFNPVFLAEIPVEIPSNAGFLLRLGATEVHYPESAEQAWRLVDAYAFSQGFPSNYLSRLHSFLLEHGYEDKLKILFYPLEWGD